MIPFAPSLSALTGNPGVECRSGGASNDYQIVVTFGGSVFVSGSPQAQVISGTGTVGANGVSNGGAVTVNWDAVTIPLTNVSKAQVLQVQLNGVNGASNFTIQMGVLIAMRAAMLS